MNSTSPAKHSFVYESSPSEHSIRLATKMAILLLVRDNDFIKMIYRRMLSLNHAAKRYDIKLPDVLTHNCIELNIYNNVYDNLRSTGKINTAPLGSPDQLVDVAQFAQIYQPVYDRALVVADKYPMVYRAINDGILRLKSFVENRLITLDYSAKMHYNGNNGAAHEFVIDYSSSILDVYNFPIARSFVSPVLECLPLDYLTIETDLTTQVETYAGKMYFELYPERLVDTYTWELPNIYESMYVDHNGVYNIHDSTPQATESVITDDIEEFDINTMLNI